MTTKEMFSEYVLGYPAKLNYALCNIGLSIDFDQMGATMFVDLDEEVRLYITPYFDGSEDLYFEIHEDGWNMPKTIEMTLEHTESLDKDYDVFVEVVMNFIRTYKIKKLTK